MSDCNKLFKNEINTRKRKEDAEVVDSSNCYVLHKSGDLNKTKIYELVIFRLSFSLKKKKLSYKCLSRRVETGMSKLLNFFMCSVSSSVSPPSDSGSQCSTSRYLLPPIWMIGVRDTWVVFAAAASRDAHQAPRRRASAVMSWRSHIDTRTPPEWCI